MSMMTEQKKQRAKAAEYTKVEGCPSKKEDLPAAERKANLAILPGCCCVLKDGWAGCTLHKNLWLSGKARMAIQLAAHPGQAHWLRTATMQSGWPFLNGTNVQ